VTPAIAADPALVGLAQRLADRAGRGAALSLLRLDGGRNNRVYRVAMQDGPPLALKSYFSDPRDPRDRLAAEWGFLRLAWRRGVRSIPEPIAADPPDHAALYGFVAGRKLDPGAIGAAEVDAAADFVLAVNAAPRDCLALAPASEACFSLEDHLATVARRVARLDALDPDAPLREAAERLVATRLAPVWRDVAREVAAAAAREGIDPAATLPASACCLSPSDFGFHNALAADGVERTDPVALTFLDFEYAGRDDPAKLVCDFFCQPEIPVPLAHFDRFLARLGDGLGLDGRDLARCRLLRDAYRVKWACIMLNEFLPLGASRRAFADQESWRARGAAQLRKAEAILSAAATPS
jgi:hypothetical protein